MSLDEIVSVVILLLHHRQQRYPRVANVDLTTFFFRRERGLVVNLQAFSVELSWYPPD